MSSSTPSSEAVLPPRATLDSLPTELKKRIVELCAEQDERFRESTKYLDEQLVESDNISLAPELDDLVGSLKRQYVASVGALFRLSKQWSELAAPFRFKTIKASQGDKSVFQFVVGPLRGHHFTRLELDPVSPTSMSAFLPFLRVLTNIQHVTVHQTSLDGAIGQHGTLTNYVYAYGEARAFAAQHLRRIIAASRSLDLVLSNDVQVRHFIVNMPTLRRLCLDIQHLRAPTAVLAVVLKHASALEWLEVRLSTEAALPAIDFTLAGLPLCPPPALTALTFHGASPPPWFFTCAALFSTTLRRLEIFSSRDSTAPLPGFDSLIFPVLTTVRISGRYISLTDLIPSFSPSACPRLESLEIDAHGISEFNASAEPMPTLAQHLQSPNSSFRSLRIFDLTYPLTAEERVYTKTWSSTHKVTARTDPVEPFPSFVLFRTGSDLPRDVDSVDDLVSSVDRAADFLASWHAQARQAPRQEEYARLAAVLRAAELARVVAET
ncbi:hypothetical protein JCM8097_005888 [Rhodosporidiobolus ruineniae]